MNWDAVGAVGEIVGALAVLFSLIYLAIQIRANTTSMESASKQAVSNEFRQWNRLHLVESHSTNWNQGLRIYPQMPSAKRSEFAAMFHDLLLFFQSAQAMHDSGSLDEGTYEGYKVFIASNINTPGGINFWEEWKSVYTPKMVLALGELLQNGRLLDILSFEQYKLDEDDGT